MNKPFDSNSHHLPRLLLLDGRQSLRREIISRTRNFQHVARMAVFVLLWLSLGVVGLRGNPGDPSHFSFTGNLATGRAAHIALLLPNGKVLVAGGSDNTPTPLLSAE